MKVFLKSGQMIGMYYPDKIVATFGSEKFDFVEENENDLGRHILLYCKDMGEDPETLVFYYMDKKFVTTTDQIIAIEED